MSPSHGGQPAGDDNQEGEGTLHPEWWWRRLTQLSSPLVRDVGAALFIPSLLHDSEELPIFHPLRSYEDCEGAWSWLVGVDESHVHAWFECRGYRRLGDHFHDCMEYALRFGGCAFLPPTDVVLHSSVQINAAQHLGTSLLPGCGSVENAAESNGTQGSEDKDEATNVPATWDEDHPNGGTSEEEAKTWAAEMEELGCSSIFGNLSDDEHQGQVGENREEYEERMKQAQEEKERKRDFYRDLYRSKHHTAQRKPKPRVTLGEFDLLFYLKSQQEALAPLQIRHVEVSVKFLLYVGTSMEPFRHTTGSQKEQEDTLASMFLGPHQGESLAERRDHLKGQLQLSALPAARAQVEELIGSHAMSGYASLRGFFFFPHTLWQEALAVRCRGSPRGGHEGPFGDRLIWKRSPIGVVNRNTVKGWWLYTHELHLLETQSHSKEARFGILSKDYWLAPVRLAPHEVQEFSFAPDDEVRLQVPDTNCEGCAISTIRGQQPTSVSTCKGGKRIGSVKDIVELLTVHALSRKIARLQEDAHARNRHRAGRVLVAEVVPQVDAGSNGIVWIERSRGFVVESDWPRQSRDV
mmetsp:Transcript_9848/g.36063  ORF Transcript_9848/g.36063 Transcript_9848/m.36063 type:complete len:579 (+) Transcript_9848:192-1928(+)